MRFSRVLLGLAVLGVAWWLLRPGRTAAPEAPGRTSDPIERARAAARRGEERNEQSREAGREADSSPAAGVTENMTPEQVRALLGPPEEVATETTEGGASRERWIYRRANRTVVFENGVVSRIE